MKTKITDRKVAEFPVSIYPASIVDPTMDRYSDGDKGAFIMRTDTRKILSWVSSDYVLVRHGDIMKQVEAVMDTLSMKYEITDIILFGKDSSSVAVRYLLDYEVKGHKPFIELRNSYDKSLTVTLQLGIYTLVCFNGMMGFKTWSLKERHLSTYDGITTKVVERVKTYVDINFPEIVTELNHLSKDKTKIAHIYGCEDLKKYFKCERDYSTFLNTKLLSNNFDRYGENLLGVLQSLTEFATHYETSGNKMLSYQEEAYSFITKNKEKLLCLN